MKWKKNILKVPQNIQDQVKTLSPKNMVTACVAKIKREQIDNGDFSHLGIKFVDGKPVFPDSILPTETTGRYSSYNIHGQEKVRRDLPMTSQSYSMEWPNYGDWDKGSHTVDYSRPVYQREYFGPSVLPQVEMEY